jgi:chromosome segregation ATPase
MQGENTAGNSPAVGLFQKAHGKMVMLQRLDSQLASLLEQRRKIQDELSGIQSQINDEFDRVMRQAEETPARILSEIADSGRHETRPVGRLAQAEPANA